MDERVIAVIDGNSLMHRAFHAVQAPMNAPDGRPTNACFGFMSMLLKLIEDFKPYGVIAAFDAGIPPSRLEAIEAYKAQRPPTDPDLKVQFPMIEALLVSLNIPVVRVPDYEGDDILGTLATLAEEHGNIKTLLITGDKDALQLASEKTHIVTNKTGMSDVRIYDPEGVVERFGVDPAHVPDYLGLMGDTSDNIPGIPGVGAKTATKLLQEYGDIEGVIAHAAELKGKLAEKVQAGAQLALDSRQVATIMRDVPLTMDFDAVRFPSFESGEVRRAFGELGMMSQMRKVLKFTEAGLPGGSATVCQTPPSPSPFAATTSAATAAYPQAAAAALPMHAGQPTDGSNLEQAFSRSMQHILEGAKAREALQELLRAFEFEAAPAVELEAATSEPQPSTQPQRQLQSDPHAHLLGLHLACAGADAARLKQAQQTLLLDDDGEQTLQLYIATQESVLVIRGQDTLELLKTLILRKLPLASFDFKEALRVLVPSDTTQVSRLNERELLGAKAFDLTVASYLLDSDRTLLSPRDFIERFLPAVNLEAFEEAEVAAQGSTSHYAAAVAASARVLAPVLSAELERAGAMECFERIEQPLTAVLVAIERNGVRVDTAVLAEQGRALSLRIDALREEAQGIAKVEFNLDSPKQVGEVLFEKLMLPTGKKTQRGYSTDASVLTELSALSPLPGIILEYRELAKLRSTYLDALPKLVAADGLIHTTFNQTVAATGRLSSSDPNLQNIPIRSELGKRIRTAFVADAAALGAEEAVFVSADYSQIELRLLAHLSDDEHLIAAFRSGEDFHRETAARVFGVKPEEVTPEMRGRAKAVNFGIVYGQQAFGLAQSLNIGFAEASEMIKRYFGAYPQVHAYLENLKVQAHEQGWVETLFGRRRQIHEVHSSNSNRRSFAERTAMNHPMQGSAADIIKLAMNRVAERLEGDGYRSRMVLQVHDELDFNCCAAELERLTKMVVQVMQQVIVLKVPLVVDLSSGPNWAVAH